MLRNRGLRAEALAGLAVVAALALAAWLSAGSTTALWVAAAGVAVLVVHLLVAAARYHDIALLARDVDQALTSKRNVSFASMGEGELAILSNEVDKALSRLAVANEDLARQRAALADSLADISHQIRTPLTSLGLELELMRRDASTSTQRMRALDAERLLERIQWLVSSLLKLARLDSGTVELVRQEVFVEDLVRQAAEPLAVSFDLRDVTLDLGGIDPQASFMGDPAWTREAVLNVLKNCLEHTPAGGMVRVTASEDALACRLAVVDSGPGIAVLDLPHVFERFYHGQVTGEDRVNPAGVGIGLSLAQALVTAQGGAITASNQTDSLGKVTGARFDFVFYKVVV